MNILKILKSKLSGIYKGLKRFPESTLLTLFLTISTIIAFESEHNADIYRNMALSLLLGLILMTGLKLMIERLKHAKITYGLSLLLVMVMIIGFNFYLTKDLSIAQITTYLTTLGATMLLFLIVPYFFSRPLFGYYCLRTCLRFCLTIFYSLVIFAGISGLVFAVESLFSVAFSEMIYMDILIASACVFGVLYFLSTIERKDQIHKKDQYPKGIKILLSNILIPLTMAYGFIMYIYFVKILITMTWPSGIVGQLVIWFGIMAFSVLFLLDGIELKKAFQKIWLKYFPYLFVIPLLMLFVSIGIRISRYGFTMLRYYVVITGIWFLLAFITTIIKYRHKTMVFIISGLILLLLSGTGPISAVNTSFLSQNRRLETVLTNEGLLVDGKLQPALNANTTSIQEISAAIFYIDELEMLDEISYLPDGFTLSKSDQYLGFELEAFTRIQNYYYYQSIDKKAIEVKGQVTMFDFPEDSMIDIEEYQLRLSNHKLYIDGQELADFNEILHDLIVQYGNNHQVQQDDLTYTFRLDRVNLIIIFDEIDIEYKATYQFDRASGIIILSDRDED